MQHPESTEETVNDIQVGKRIPIFVLGTMRLVGEFVVINIDRARGVCDVRWPNDHIDKDVPLEEMLGQMTLIDKSELGQYISR